jgi:hypothetical protein
MADEIKDERKKADLSPKKTSSRIRRTRLLTRRNLKRFKKPTPRAIFRSSKASRRSENARACISPPPRRPGLHHLVWEIVDNSIDEALAGYCKNIEVTINKGNSVTVEDDGRGVPTDIVAKSGLSGVEPASRSCTPAANSAKAAAIRSPAASTASAPRSLTPSAPGWMSAFSKTAANISSTSKMAATIEHLKRVGDTTKRGTIVTFQPDPTIFTETTVYDYDTIKNHLRQMAFLNGGIKITLTDNRGETPVTETFFMKAASKNTFLHQPEQTSGQPDRGLLPGAGRRHPARWQNR